MPPSNTYQLPHPKAASATPVSARSLNARVLFLPVSFLVRTAHGLFFLSAVLRSFAPIVYKSSGLLQAVKPTC
jgi:hypothetical protein